MLYHPMIELRTKAWAFISDLLITQVSESLTPGAIVQFSPITTLGPITEEESTFAVGCIKTFPIMLSPLASSSLP